MLWIIIILLLINIFISIFNEPEMQNCPDCICEDLKIDENDSWYWYVDSECGCDLEELKSKIEKVQG